MIKLIAVVARNPDWDDAQWYSHYRDRHGPLVAATRGFTDHTVCYRQNYVLAAADCAPAEPTSPVCNGVTELWFENMSALASAFASADYLSIIRPDEDIFANRETIIAGVGTEHQMYIRPARPFDAATGEQAEIHLFIFSPTVRHSEAIADEQAVVPSERKYPLPGSVHRHLQTRFAAADMGFKSAQLYAIVDEYWFDSEQEASDYLRSQRRASAEHNSDPPGGGSGLSLLTRSHVVFEREGWRE
jgi:hypothetical protein